MSLIIARCAAASKAAVDAESYELRTLKGGAWWHEPAGCLYQRTITGEQGKQACHVTSLLYLETGTAATPAGFVSTNDTAYA